MYSIVMLGEVTHSREELMSPTGLFNMGRDDSPEKSIYSSIFSTSVSYGNAWET